MKRSGMQKALGLTVVLMALVLAGVLAKRDSIFAMPIQKTQTNKVEDESGELTVSGPFTHKNLSLFLVHGKDQMGGKEFITLEEAMKQKLVIIHETGSVQQLAVENISADQTVFIQGGEIIKGGKQDRVIPFDMVLSPKSGKIPIKSFCVESGRWQKRGGEKVGEFSTSNSMVSSKGLRRAARGSKQQDDVWNEVATSQGKLSANVSGFDARTLKSSTSLQLTLENKDILKAQKEYVEKLKDSAKGKADALGVVVVINGKIISADIYGSPKLFIKLWPKLLNAAANEALAEFKKDLKFDAVKAEDAKKLLLAGKGKKTKSIFNSNKRTGINQIILNDKDGNLWHNYDVTRDREAANEAIIHKNYY
jgi:ARG and Rhodanese-Phosphatase-superfamily-associated Protein domain